MGQALITAHAQRVDRALATHFAVLAGTEFSLLETAQEICCRVSVDFCLHEGAHRAAPVAAEFNRLALVDMAGAGRWFRWFPASPRRRLADVERACIDLLRDQVSSRVAERYAGTPRDLLDVMVDQRSGPPLTPEHGARMLKTILAAARGIPGAAFAWIIRELSRNAVICDEIRAESAALSDAVKMGDVHRLPYTHAVVQELLRIHPPIWLLGRVAVRPTRLAQWTISPGERVVFSLHQIHHDPRWWTEPQQTDPQRWLGDQRPHRHRYAYLPFGGGPRVCLGARLGMLQLTLATARLARDYDIDMINDGRAVAQHSVLRAPVGLRARLVARTPQAKQLPPPLRR
jgi:unspecific monooxygenase